MGTLFIFHKGLHGVAASLKTSHLRQSQRLSEGFPYEEKSTGPWIHCSNQPNITIYYKKENYRRLDIVALQHVFVLGVWLFESFKRAKPAGFRSCYRSDQKWSFPFAVHFSLLLALRDTSKDEIALLDFSRSHFFCCATFGFPPGICRG